VQNAVIELKEDALTRGWRLKMNSENLPAVITSKHASVPVPGKMIVGGGIVTSDSDV
jgi:hypothetical protein